VYQALYRKWRPRTFDEVVGQQHITETLKNQVRTGRLSHAYIFIGTRGTGKTTCARILARAVNCEHPTDGNPCGVCDACRGILDGSVLDVVELDAASNNGVDNVRTLREEAVFSPTTVRKRVYIIDEVHMMSTAAFNALLKILEEPPEHLMFILATTELQKVPATILSRCQRHSFKRIETPVIAKYLSEIAVQEHFDLSPEAADLIARLAEGGVRDALSLLDQCSASERIDAEAVYSAIGLAGNRRIAQLLDLILRRDAAAVLDSFQKMWMDGKDPAAFLRELASLLRDVLMLRMAPKTGTALLSGAYDAETLGGFAGRMTNEQLLWAMNTIQAAQDRLRSTASPRMTAELCLISLCDERLEDGFDSLAARVSRLEDAVKEGFTMTPGPARITPPTPAEEEEELDFEQFREEQPEDIFFDRPATPAPPPDREDIRREKATAEGDGLWPAIRRRVLTQLSMQDRIALEDDTKLSAHLSGDTLHLEAVSGFTYGRVNRQEILNRFAEAARAETGREVRVALSEMAAGQGEKRSWDELKQIRELRILDDNA